MTDAKLPPGIRLHTLKDGSTSYEARVHRKGSTSLTQRFETLKEARQWKTKIDVLIDGGIDPRSVMPKKASAVSAAVVPQDSVTPPSPTSADPLTVRKAIERYLKHREQSHNKLPANQVTNYERVAMDWDNFLVSKLRNEDLSNYISALMRTPLKSEAKRMAKGTLQGEPKTYSEASVRKFIYAMKVALEWYSKNSKMKLNDFLFDFDKNVVPAAWAGHRERRLAAGEEEKLYEAGVVRGDITYTPEDWRALIGFTLESAMRQQELAKAEWKQIVADGYKLLIPAKHSKTKTGRTILLSKRAREIIETQRKSCPEKNTRIFHQFTSASSICESFAKLTARAGIENLTFHDLRHEATSRLCESGKLSMMAIMEMTGHSSMRTFKGYVHLIAHDNDLRLE